MLSRKPLILFVLLVAAAGFTESIVNPANAQTGPTGPTGAGTGPAVNVTTSMSPAAPKLSPEALTKHLRDKGHKVNPGKGSDGRTVLYVHVEKNNWKFDIEIEYSPDQASFFLICPLGKSGAQYTAPQLMAILKGSYELSPTRFVIRPSDSRLCLENSWNSIMTLDYFQTIFDQLTNNVQRTHSVWDESRWANPVSPSGPVAGTTIP